MLLERFECSGLAGLLLAKTHFSYQRSLTSGRQTLERNLTKLNLMRLRKRKTGEEIRESGDELAAQPDRSETLPTEIWRRRKNMREGGDVQGSPGTAFGLSRCQ